MQPPALGPRVLLRQLREVMAGPEKAQDRLDKITRLIAANVVAEVCSIYVLRPDGELELFASEGLKPEAVHRTRMKMNEGLVGTIASESRLLNLSDAQRHPAFKFMPETGEEIFHSFLGVPILKNGRPIGVLVVQNETRRHYSPEEEEAVQTTAMVLAEILSSGEFNEEIGAGDSDVSHLHRHYLKGQPLAGGIAMGHAVLHEPRVVITNLVAASIEEEQMRLEEAIGALREQVDDLFSKAEVGRAADYGEILETYRMFANDRGWVKRIARVIDSGLTAEAAVERVQNENRARMLKASDPYLRDRLHDLDDLANRLLKILTGTAMTAAQETLPDDTIIVARAMGPAELLDYDRDKLRGLVLEEGGTGSHVTIVARALGIACVGQVENITEMVDTGDALIVDGGAGDLHVRPSQDIEAAYGEKVRFYARKQAQYRAMREVEPVTLDGRRISLNINAGLLVDLPHLDESGADGIGLFRTELQFMLSRSLPRHEAQVRHYRAVLDAAGDRPVVFRSLDIGSDKMLPYLSNTREDNPALGWRALRMSLDRPALMKLQVRSLLKAAGRRNLRLMFPMVAELDEFLQARKIVFAEQRRLQASQYPVPDDIKLGLMVEVPSMIWQLEAALPELDFVSVGSNDLVQYMFAADRGHPRVGGRYDVLSPAILGPLAQVVRVCAAAKVPLSLCGEMAGNPLEAMALIGIGFDNISMAPSSVGPVKAMLLKLNQSHLAKFMTPLLATPVHSLRPQLHAYARGNKIPI